MDSEISTTSILALFETNKDQRQDFALRVIDALQAGQVDPLKIHLQVKCMEDIIKLLNSNTIYKKSVLEAAEKFSEKSFQFNNAKVEIKETGVKYDYSQCADPVHSMLEQKLDSAANDLKQRETFLKTVPEKGIVLTDEQTGETFPVYPPAKSSTTNVVVTLK
jgi:hypothetical protein